MKPCTCCHSCRWEFCPLSCTKGPGTHCPPFLCPQGSKAGLFLLLPKSSQFEYESEKNENFQLLKSSLINLKINTDYTFCPRITAVIVLMLIFSSCTFFSYSMGRRPRWNLLGKFAPENSYGYLGLVLGPLKKLIYVPCQATGPKTNNLPNISLSLGPTSIFL
jgi:hypothetical protein